MARIELPSSNQPDPAQLTTRRRMKSRVVKTSCGICAAMSGLKLTIDEDGHVSDIRGDMDDPVTAGYACIKGYSCRKPIGAWIVCCGPQASR